METQEILINLSEEIARMISEQNLIPSVSDIINDISAYNHDKKLTTSVVLMPVAEAALTNLFRALFEQCEKVHGSITFSLNDMEKIWDNSYDWTRFSRLIGLEENDAKTVRNVVFLIVRSSQILNSARPAQLTMNDQKFNIINRQGRLEIRHIKP